MKDSEMINKTSNSKNQFVELSSAKFIEERELILEYLDLKQVIVDFLSDSQE